jgi:hypothetical protein
MLMAVGFCFIGAGVIVLVIRGLAGDYVVSALSRNGTARPAADAVWSIGTSVLVDVADSAIVVGLPFVAAGWVAGPSTWARSVRRALAGPLTERPAYVWLTVALVLLVLIVWAPIRAFRNPFGLLLIVALVVAGVEVLRRQIAQEFPNARAPELEDLVREGAKRLRAAAGRLRRPGRAPASPEASRLEQLERLAALHERGALTDEEFAAEKAALPRPGDGAGT